LQLDNRIILGSAAVVIMVVIAIVAFLPSSGLMKSIFPQGSNVPSTITAISANIKPLSISYNGTSVSSFSERSMTFQTNFYVTNPNPTTIILEAINYDISADGTIVGYGQIGSRYEGSWESSYYFPLIAGTSSNVGNSTIFENTGNYPDLWSALEKGTAKITVSGTAYYATKTAFNGNDYSQEFNFTQ